MKNSILFLGLIALKVALSHSAIADVAGIYMTDSIQDDVILESSRVNIAPENAAPLIERYILNVNPDRDQQYPHDLNTKDLAKRIAGVSYCFGIDPFIFTSLIQKESINYNQRAKSPTGAVGLTQFTTIAMREVNDQLGFRGTKYAQSSAINYFEGLVMSSCLEKNGGFESMGANYVPMWSMKPANALPDGSRSQASKMVALLASKPEYALVYGAILLKVNYSMVVAGYKSGCYTYAKNKPVTMKDKIKELVMMYNGDGCETQKKYQSDIINKYYERITGVEAK